MSTGEDWYKIMFDMTRERGPKYDCYSTSCEGSCIIYFILVYYVFFFIMYILLIQYIMLNLFILVLM
jgi:hypothetical protein